MKTMKAMIIACVSIIVLLSSCRIETAKELGPTKTANINVQSFDAIHLSCGADVVYHVSDTFSVSIEAPEKLMSSYKIESDGKTLSIWEDSSIDGKVIFNMGEISDDCPVTVHVYAPSIAAVNVTGSGEVKCKETLQAGKFTGTITGSGDIDFAAVKADTLTLQVTGSGEIGIDRVEAVSSTAQISGSGEIELNLANCQTASATITGSGEIKLIGTVGQLNQQITGSGSINTDKLTTTK